MIKVNIYIVSDYFKKIYYIKSEQKYEIENFLKFINKQKEFLNQILTLSYPFNLDTKMSLFCYALETMMKSLNLYYTMGFISDGINITLKIENDSFIISK